MEIYEGCTSRHIRPPWNETVGFRNVVMPIAGKSCTKFNNNLNSLQSYYIAQNYSIINTVVQCLSQHNHKISHHGHI
jgi:hypothetical protein